jgi:hypothetical protein
MMMHNGMRKGMEFPFKLPVDEDDYLMPSPGPLGHNPNYMDLIGDTKVPGMSGMFNRFLRLT